MYDTPCMSEARDRHLAVCLLNGIHTRSTTATEQPAGKLKVGLEFIQNLLNFLCYVTCQKPQASKSDETAPVIIFYYDFN